MIPPAPKEPRADQILQRWLAWVGTSRARLMPNLRRLAAIDRRRDERAATVLGIREPAIEPDAPRRGKAPRTARTPRKRKPRPAA